MSACVLLESICSCMYHGPCTTFCLAFCFLGCFWVQSCCHNCLRTPCLCFLSLLCCLETVCTAGGTCHAGPMASWTGMTLAMYATIQMMGAGMITSPSPASVGGTASSWQKPSKGPCHCQKPSRSWRSLIRSLTGTATSILPVSVLQCTYCFEVALLPCQSSS